MEYTLEDFLKEAQFKNHTLENKQKCETIASYLRDKYYEEGNSEMAMKVVYLYETIFGKQITTIFQKREKAPVAFTDYLLEMVKNGEVILDRLELARKFGISQKSVGVYLLLMKKEGLIKVEVKDAGKGNRQKVWTIANV